MEKTGWKKLGFWVLKNGVYEKGIQILQNKMEKKISSHGIIKIGSQQ